MAVGSVISKVYDLTNYNKLWFEYECSVPIAQSYNIMKVFIVSSKQMNMTAVAEQLILPSNVLNYNGTVDLDISAISGKYYIGFYIRTNVNSNNGDSSITVINPRLE